MRVNTILWHVAYERGDQAGMDAAAASSRAIRSSYLGPGEAQLSNGFVQRTTTHSYSALLPFDDLTITTTINFTKTYSDQGHGMHITLNWFNVIVRNTSSQFQINSISGDYGVRGNARSFSSLATGETRGGLPSYHRMVNLPNVVYIPHDPIGVIFDIGILDSMTGAQHKLVIKHHVFSQETIFNNQLMTPGMNLVDAFERSLASVLSRPGR